MRITLAVAIVSSLTMMACNNNETKKINQEDISKKNIVVADSTIAKKGKSIAMGTFKVLSSKLKAAIQSGGPVAGIGVCSTEAMKLTDSISKANNVVIKRTSLKYRNEKNTASNSERIILESWQTQIDNGTPIKPNIVRDNNGEITFVAPIKLKNQCVVCHGNDDQVSPDVKLKLAEHYPNDTATNYKPGDLRGAWVITFPKDYFTE